MAVNRLLSLRRANPDQRARRTLTMSRLHSPNGQTSSRGALGPIRSWLNTGSTRDSPTPPLTTASPPERREMHISGLRRATPQTHDLVRAHPGKLRRRANAACSGDRSYRRPRAGGGTAIRGVDPVGPGIRVRADRGDRRRMCGPVLRGARHSNRRSVLSDERTRLLPALGRRRQGASTRRNDIRTCGRTNPRSAQRSTIGAPVEQLDLATVLKVSEAVSGEIVLEKLIDTLLRTAIEHAGAERGLLILPRGLRAADSGGSDDRRRLDHDRSPRLADLRR